jgi:molybdate transport system substrate-binding protein
VRSLAAAAAAAAAAVLLLAGCAPAAEDGADAAGGATVFAAASLTASFTELADRFEKAHPGAAIELSFAGSADLAAQLVEGGAPADVFASADEATMQKVVAAGLVASDPADFATNTLQIVVPPGNPAGVETLADLAGVRAVVCAPQVPCGAAAERVAEVAGVGLTPVSEESNVTDVLGKVAAGEADAGLVYATDVLGAAERVEGIVFPEASVAVNTYSVAALTESAVAADFVAFVLSGEGRAVLADAGFQAP